MRRGRENLFEELGRVEGEHSNKNRRAEVSRIHGELNKGYKSGNLVEAAKKGVSKWKEKQKAAKGITKKAADALQKHIQTKNVKRLTTTGGAYKKRAPIKVVDKKTSAHPGGGYHGYKMYKAGGPARTIGKSKDTLRDKLKKLRPRHAGKRKNPFEALGGGEKGKPHSTEKGRIAAGARKVLRTLKARPQLERQRSMDRKPSPKVKPEWPKKENIMTPLRAKKAGGGRISRGHGGSAAQQHYLQHGYGPTKAKLRTGKPKIAKKGWA